MKKREEAFASPPGRPGSYVLYIEHGYYEAVQIYAAAYAAKKFIELVLGDEEYMVEGHVLRSDRGIRIRSERLPEIMGHTYTLAELGWQVPYPHTSDAHRIRFPPPEPTELPRSLKQKRPPELGRRVSHGFVSIQEICGEMGIQPKDARKVLRAKKVERTNLRWAWPREKVDQIKQILAHLKRS